MTSIVHKSMAIPVTLINGEYKFLIVHDRRFHEWTFVTGGCRKREVFNPIRCAIRELEEETRGIINLRKGTYNYFRFSINFEPTEESIYHVYIFHVNINENDMTNIERKFDEEKIKMDTNQVSFRKNYDENDNLIFTTLDELRQRGNVWKLISEKIVNNPDFYTALNSPKYNNFYMMY